ETDRMLDPAQKPGYGGLVDVRLAGSGRAALNFLVVSQRKLVGNVLQVNNAFPDQLETLCAAAIQAFHVGFRQKAPTHFVQRTPVRSVTVRPDRNLRILPEPDRL